MVVINVLTTHFDLLLRSCLFHDDGVAILVKNGSILEKLIKSLVFYGLGLNFLGKARWFDAVQLEVLIGYFSIELLDSFFVKHLEFWNSDN